ncbi:phosphotransferase family protein [Conexibacter sp. SYSU D00693]|uniref:phosphotransferase family protein n=1 Tax=Conexibacter sp. SYSU D00693 TaxID=2812560 RepID=UPI00196B6918|nr:phosphotransferase family protein [Conexibacter sp. SYSU D00693]
MTAELVAAAPDPALLREALVDAGAPDPGPDVAIERLAGGASRESWTVGGRWVLKRDHPTETDPPMTAAKELRALVAARDAGVPVPEPLCAEPAGGRFGTAGYVAALVPGTSSPRRVLALDDGARLAVAQDLGAALGALAGVDASDVVDVPAGGAVGAVLADLAEELDAVAPERAVLAVALRVLELHPPPEADPVLVHGDFRLGNVLVDGGRVRAIIDWEFCRAGDPAEDLGFLCLRPWRFGADGRRAGGLAGLEPVLDAYRAACGPRLAALVDPRRVAYWEAVGQLRWGLYCLRHAAGYAEGRHRHLERAVLGRRIAEVEWDLLDLVEELA